MAVRAERDYDRTLQHQAAVEIFPVYLELIPNILGASSNDNGLAYACHIL